MIYGVVVHKKHYKDILTRSKMCSLHVRELINPAFHLQLSFKQTFDPMILQTPTITPNVIVLILLPPATVALSLTLSLLITLCSNL